MPSNHFNLGIIGRGTKPRGKQAKQGKGKPRDKPQSAVACAAYRSGERLFDEKENTVFDYSRKEDILHAEIMTPEGAPAWANDRQTLWNKVEAFETRRDARLARAITAGLHRELTFEQNLALLREFVQTQILPHGMAADIAIHEADAGDGGKNPHAHLMLTVRRFEGESFAARKGNQWNDKTLLVAWRNAWERMSNDALAKAGRSERVSLRTLKEQGIDRLPETHLGYEAGNLEKRGQESKRGKKNRKTRHQNKVNETTKKLFPSTAKAEQETAPTNKGRGLQEVARDLESANSNRQRDGQRAHFGGTNLPPNDLRQIARKTETPAPSFDERRALPPAHAKRRQQAFLERTVNRMRLGLAETQTAVRMRTRWLAGRSREIGQAALARLSRLMSNREVAETLRKEREKAYEHER